MYSRVVDAATIVFRSFYVGVISLAAAACVGALTILPILAVRALGNANSAEPVDGYFVTLAHDYPVLVKTVPLVIFLGGFVGGLLRFSRTDRK